MINKTLIETKENIKNLPLKELEEFIISVKLPKYRATQIFTEIYTNKKDSFSQMNSLPLEIRNQLSELFEINSFASTSKQISIDGSVKFLFKLLDGNAVESVYMPWIDGDSDTPSRTTLCISSQVGCAVDCKFCATGKLGFTRNLETNEIVDQVLEVEKQLGVRITNIVFMGMGEPLLNFKSLINSIDILCNEKIDMVKRKRITVSTSGVVPKIKQLAEIAKPVKLAISLHATTNGVRDQIVPLNKKMNIQKILEAVDFYYQKTKLPITYEYIPFDNLNDTEEDAKRLAKIAKRVPSRINLIPFNDISFTNPTGMAAELKPTPKDKILVFAEQIRFYGGVVIIRDTFGSDIDAACGQLALSEKRK